MPHKKNPDVFELLRAHCNRIQTLPNQILSVTNNLPSGYFRDMQLIKEMFIPAFAQLNDCLAIASFALENVRINENVMDDERYRYVYSVEEVNQLVLAGVPFRDAYKTVGTQINEGNFTFCKTLNHTHEGSIGNLCLGQIKTKMDDVICSFHFEKAEKAINSLLNR